MEYGENGWEEASKAQNAKAMAKYAAAMMRSLKEMDYDKFDLRKRPDFQLRYTSWFYDRWMNDFNPGSGSQRGK